jgi:hypothetical protein
MNTAAVETITAQDIAAAIHGIVPTAEANDRVIYVRDAFVGEVREMAYDLGAVEVQAHPSALFGRYVVTIWMD